MDSAWCTATVQGHGMWMQCSGTVHDHGAQTRCLDAVLGAQSRCTAMVLGDGAWARGEGMLHGHGAWACSTRTVLGHGARRPCTDTVFGHGAWAWCLAPCMDVKFGHGALWSSTVPLPGACAQPLLTPWCRHMRDTPGHHRPLSTALGTALTPQLTPSPHHSVRPAAPCIPLPPGSFFSPFIPPFFPCFGVYWCYFLPLRLPVGAGASALPRAPQPRQIPQTPPVPRANPGRIFPKSGILPQRFLP